MIDYSILNNATRPLAIYGPADVVYSIAGPWGLTAVLALILLAPMLVWFLVVPRIAPFLVPQYVKFMAFVDEFEDNPTYEISDPAVQQRVSDILIDYFTRKK